MEDETEVQEVLGDEEMMPEDVHHPDEHGAYDELARRNTFGRA